MQSISGFVMGGTARKDVGNSNNDEEKDGDEDGDGNNDEVATKTTTS